MSALFDQCRLVDLPKITDTRGNLSFLEGTRHLPFEIKRVFYLYDVPAGAERGGHALKKCNQFLIALSGCFDVLVTDGQMRTNFTLNRPFQGLYIPPLIWREMANFSSGSVCLVLASERYDEHDYFRDYESFLTHLGVPK